LTTVPDVYGAQGFPDEEYELSPIKNRGTLQLVS